METAARNANSYMPPSIANATIRLAIIKAKKSPLMDYMQKKNNVEVDLMDVRKRISKITSSMAVETIESRG